MTASREDRELAADVVRLVGDLDGFGGIYALENRSEYDAVILVEDERSRTAAAARLTVLPGRVLIASSISSLGHGERIVPTEVELAAAAERERDRRAAWAQYRLDVHARRAGGHAPSVLIVSASPAEHANTLRAISLRALTTYGIGDPARALDVLAVYAVPDLIVLDRDLPGATELEAMVRAKYPLRFGAAERVQWLSTKQGLSPAEADGILRALGTCPAPNRRGDPFWGVSILVVDHPDGRLVREVEIASRIADVQLATGWDALERLHAEAFDVVIVGEPGDVKLSTLVRFVQREASDAKLVLAMRPHVSARMRDAYPTLAHFFVERPLGSKDLLRVLGR